MYYADGTVHHGILKITLNFKERTLEGLITVNLTDDKTKVNNGYLKASISNGKIVGPISARIHQKMGNLHISSYSEPYYYNPIVGQFNLDDIPVENGLLQAKPIS